MTPQEDEPRYVTTDEANAKHAFSLEGRADSLRALANDLVIDGRTDALATERIVGFHVAAALNEVAAALLRCA